MTWEWYQPSALLFLAAPAAGHLYHFILAINISAGIGLTEHQMGRARKWILFLFCASTTLLIAFHLRAPWWTWPTPAWLYGIGCVVSGLIIFPVCSLLIRFRPRPAEIVGDSTIRSLAPPENPHEFVGTGQYAWLLRLPGNESFQLQLRNWTVPLQRLPHAWDGLRIVQLTDLHLAPCIKIGYFERVIEACRTWDADLILLTGDVVEHEDAIPLIEPLLRHLSARIGKYAILGNHDEDCGPQAILRELERAGFETLEGRWTSINIEGATLALGGTAAPWGPEPDPQQIPPADFRVLLSHCPDLFYKAERWGVDLMLSGHNHGGQIRLPGIGPVFMPSVYSRHFDRGFFRRRNLLLYVSEGVAGLHPVRYGCPPEITSFVLQSMPVQPTAKPSRTHSARKPHHPNLEADCV